jgi:tetratricopeptide (TPR) repeat protein
LGDQERISGTLNDLGNVATLLADYSKAQSLYEGALVITRGLGDKRGTAYLMNGLGNLARRHGEYDVAWHLHQDSLVTFHDLQDKEGIAGTLAMIGSLAATVSRYQNAAELFGASQALYESIGIPMLSPAERLLFQYDKAVASLPAALGEEACELGWERGRHMTLEEAVTSALQANS